MTLAFLLQTAPPSGGGTSGTGSLFMITMIFVIMYLVLIRPQQRQRRQLEDSLRVIKRGDRIVTGGGIVGEVIHIKEGVKDGKPAPTMEDEVTIKSGESRLIVERGRIARIANPSAEPPKS